MSEANAILAISFRDLMKLLRDPARMVTTFIFPLIFIGILGGSLQSNLSPTAGYNFLAFVFTGVLAQTLFQSTAQGVISLIEDRENDFSQEIFVSPASRYAIVVGKILGESLVALPQALAILAVGLLLGVPMSPLTVLALLPIVLAMAIFGGAFGLLVLSRISTQRAASQVFAFIMLPQFFLAGVFNPIHALPLPLAILSALSPLRYAVELTRNVMYGLQPGVPEPAMTAALINLPVIAGSFAAFLVAGTVMFVRAERNR